MHVMPVDLLGRGHAFQHQHNGTPRSADIDWFVGSIQDKHRGVHRRVAALGELVTVRTECSVTLHWRNPQSGQACKRRRPAGCPVDLFHPTTPTADVPGIPPLRGRSPSGADSVFTKDEIDVKPDSGAATVTPGNSQEPSVRLNKDADGTCDCRPIPSIPVLISSSCPSSSASCATVRAGVTTHTRAAPAWRSSRAHSPAVAPVVSTSSTSRTSRPFTRSRAMTLKEP